MTAMRTLSYLLATATAVAGGALATGCAPSPSAPRAEHVVLVSIDTLRRDRLPVYGYARETAPSLSRLAESAVVFDEAIAACVNTAPSHASMLTGLYPPAHGVLFNRSRLRDGVLTLAETLRERGFRTGAFVSGYTLDGGHTGLSRGFEVYDDEMNEDRERIAERTFERARTWLRGSAPDAPTFLFVHFFDPHYPYRPPESYARRFAGEGDAPVATPPYREFRERLASGLRPAEASAYEDLYDAEILYADRHVGLLIEELQSLGILDRTLLVVLSDHGETLSERTWMFDHGSRLYDEQVRIPLIVRFPGGRHGGTRSTVESHHVDVVPTVLDVLDLPPMPATDGISLAERVASGGVADGRALYTVGRSDPRRVPEVPADIEPGRLLRSVRLPPYKLIAYPVEQGAAAQLFALDSDPAERTDVALERPSVTRELFGRIQRWYERGAAGLPDEEPVLDPEREEALRSLGYVN